MAEELTIQERRQRLKKQTKRLKRSMTKEQKAEQRRQQLAKKQKRLTKKIESTKGEKKKANLKEEKKEIRQKKKAKSATAHAAAKRSDKIEARRQKTATYTRTKKGTPGVKNDTIDPFLTSDQIAERADKTNEYNDTISNLQYALKMQQTETDYNKQMIDKQKPYDLEKANSSAAGRGLFSSSIRDASLYDIDATAALNKANYDREFDAMRMDTERQALQATNAFNTYKQALNQAAVDNAADASEGMELYKVDPTKAVTSQHQLKIRPVDVKPIKPGRSDGRGTVRTGGNGPGANVPPGGPTGPRPNVNNNNGPGGNGPTGGRPNPNRNRNNG